MPEGNLNTLYVADRTTWRQWLHENYPIADESVWRNFTACSGAYQRIRVAYIDTVRKRPGEFEKRLTHLIRMTAQNKQFGFGIEDYY